MYFHYFMDQSVFFRSCVTFHSVPLVVHAVMNNYQAAAAAAAQGFGPAASPHGATTAQQQRVAAAAAASFSATNSPGPVIDMYNSSAADGVGYVQAASPQPSGFPAIAVSRAPLNYSPVRRCTRFGITVARKRVR